MTLGLLVWYTAATKFLASCFHLSPLMHVRKVVSWKVLSELMWDSQEIHNCVTDCHDMTFAVEMAWNSITNIQTKVVCLKMIDKYIFCSWTLSLPSSSFYVSSVQVFWKHCGKRRNCSQLAISPFPTVFSTLLENFTPFPSNLKL